jgi:hypothetical protein
MDVMTKFFEDILIIHRRSSPWVSLWNGQNETWLSDIDLSLLIPCDYARGVHVALSKDLLAVVVCHGNLEHRVLFFRIKTSQPVSETPQFMSMKQFPVDTFSVRGVSINEKWCIFETGYELKVFALRLSDLFSKDQNHVGDVANVANYQEAEDPWRPLNHVLASNLVHIRDLSLKPGNSGLLAVDLQMRGFSHRTFKIVNLDTSETLITISNEKMDLFHLNWCGDAFLYLKELPLSDDTENSSKFRLVILDTCQMSHNYSDEDLAKDSSHLRRGFVLKFPQLEHSRYKDLSHIDYSGVVLCRENRLHFAHID